MGNKKIINLIFIVFMIVLFACCEKKSSVSYDDYAEVESNISLTCAITKDIDTVASRVVLEFKKNVDELSNGSITIDINEIDKSKEDEILDNFVSGKSDVDMALIDVMDLEHYDVELSKILYMPYTFIDKNHYYDFAKSELAEKMLLEPKDIDLPFRGIIFIDSGYRYFFAKKVVRNIAGFNGLKIYVPNIPIISEMTEALSSTPIIMKRNELINIYDGNEEYFDKSDGIEGTIENIKNKKVLDRIKTVVLDGHMIDISSIIISDIAYKRLSIRQQEILKEAKNMTLKFNREFVDSDEENFINDCNKKNIEVVFVTDKIPYINAIKKLVKSQIVNYEELYENILDFDVKGIIKSVYKK